MGALLYTVHATHLNNLPSLDMTEFIVVNIQCLKQHSVGEPLVIQSLLYPYHMPLNN